MIDLLTSKIALGTVQFGMDYGINNPVGKVSNDEVYRILKYAHDNGIDCIDTARAYGDSENIIGGYLKENGNVFNVFSKISPTYSSVNIDFRESIDRLTLDCIQGYMFHDFDSYVNNANSHKDLMKLKEQGYVNQIGFSVYYPKQIEYLLKHSISFDVVQLPYSIFDRRFEYLFNELKNKGVEIHIRSVFLQGLAFMNINNISSHFDSIKNKLLKLRKIVNENNLNIASLCLNFCLANKHIDKVIVGVDSLDNLKVNITQIKDFELVRNLIKGLECLKINDEKILLPFNWK